MLRLVSQRSGYQIRCLPNGGNKAFSANLIRRLLQQIVIAIFQAHHPFSFPAHCLACPGARVLVRRQVSVATTHATHPVKGESINVSPICKLPISDIRLTRTDTQGKQ